MSLIGEKHKNIYGAAETRRTSKIEGQSTGEMKVHANVGRIE